MKNLITVGAFALSVAVAAGSQDARPTPERPAAAPPEETSAPYASANHGALRVKGDTGDWFLITQGGKPAGQSTPPRLNDAVELAPGTYEVAVNKTKRSVTVRAGKETVLQTGTLVVEGRGADWYSPYEGKEQRVTDAPPTLNKPIALFAGTYSVLLRVGDRDVKLTDSAKVVAGQRTVLKK
jgi:hypothetical protein